MRTASLFLAVLTLFQAGSTPPDYELFIEAGQPDERQGRAALDKLTPAWKNAYTAMIIDIARFLKPAPRSVENPTEDANPLADHDVDDGGPPRRTATVFAPTVRDPGSPQRRRLLAFLEKQTGQKFGDDLDKWRQWMWKLPYEPHPDYAAFKGQVYSNVDPRMARFFTPGVKATIRLDEVDWGGVPVNGIPPLVNPKVVSASEATFLRGGNVVFGITINGESRAYPKRILAWHELARDRVGGVELTIVYCTLCGTVLPYESNAGGRLRVLGTSGLLYRSNKLMFDEETASLWSTLEGKPVIGPLAGTDVELALRSSVTTTWREWREAHPDTTVLSLDTGFDRDYSEGAAYRDYFATDRLMFQVPRQDNRLKNKAEVLVLRLPEGDREIPVAIAVDFLKKNPVYTHTVGGRSYVVVTTPDGANRVYDSGAVRFTSRSAPERVVDSKAGGWKITEDSLVPESGGERLARVTANRAFWFGWYAQFPDTQLVK